MSNIVTEKKAMAALVGQQTEQLEIDVDDRRYARIGWLIILLGFGGFLLWALTAPLDRGVPMSGVVAKESNRQAVQHQAGGTVRELLVREGSVVKAGQVLVRLDPVNAQSQLEMTRLQYLGDIAAEARLLAERADKPAITFPEQVLKEKSDPRVAEIISVQTQLFASRRASLQSELAAYDENIAGLKLQRRATEESHAAKKQQQAFLKEQLAGMRDLAKDGFVARNRLLDLERTYAQINGSLSEDEGSIGRSQRQIMELSLRRAQRMQDYQKEVGNHLSDVQKEATSLQSRLVAQAHELDKIEVRAPVSGTVVGLAVFTEGGVVASGFKMMDIVPSDDALVVDGSLPTHLVDKVHPGLPVDLVFSAFNVNKTPHIPGEVVTVSADRTVDERSGQAHYLVKVKVTPEGAKLIAEHKLAIRSGMPVELFVKTGERTFMNYLMKPLVDRSHGALSEE